MKNLSGYWISNVDNKFTNFGDILGPYVLSKYDINLNYKAQQPQLYTIGSLLHMMPDDYQGYIWSSGYMFPTKTLSLKKDPICVRGKLSKKYFTNDTSNTEVGDGGLLLDKIYKPRETNIRYKLGVFPNYCDIINMRDDPLEKFVAFDRPDVKIIDPRNYIDTVINDVNSCDNIITSSLHGAVVCDSYNINYGVFSARETDLAIHKLQGSFKFQDYYSIYDKEFNGVDLFVHNKVSFEECMSICKSNNKPNLENVKYYLEKSIERIKNII